MLIGAINWFEATSTRHTRSASTEQKEGKMHSMYTGKRSSIDNP